MVLLTDSRQLSCGNRWRRIYFDQRLLRLFLPLPRVRHPCGPLVNSSYGIVGRRSRCGGGGAAQ